MVAGGETAAHRGASTRQPPRAERRGGAPLPPDRTLVQEDSGAVTVEIYADRIEARGFVDGKRVTVKN